MRVKVKEIPCRTSYEAEVHAIYSGRVSWSAVSKVKPGLIEGSAELCSRTQGSGQNKERLVDVWWSIGSRPGCEPHFGLTSSSCEVRWSMGTGMIDINSNGTMDNYKRPWSSV